MMHMHYRSGVDATMATRVVIGSKAKKTLALRGSPLPINVFVTNSGH